MFHQDVSPLFRASGFRFLFVVVSCYFICQIVPFGAPDFHEAERYLSVMVPLVFLLMVMLLDRVRSGESPYSSYVRISFLMWCIYPVLRTCYHLVEKNSYGQW